MDQKVIQSNLLLPYLEDSYRDEYTEYKRRNLRCSDAGAAADEGEKCEREIFYDMKIPEKKSPLTTGTLVLFDDGRIHEQDIRRRLRLVLRSPEKELMDEELHCRGKIDNKVYARSIIDAACEILKDIFPDEVIGTDPILELKSVNEYSYQWMAANNCINQTYYDQVQDYLHIEKQQWAIVLIKNRNSSGAQKGALPFLEFIILADPERQAQIRAGLKTVNDCVANNILPPRPFLKESTKCSYCRFKFHCRPELLEKKEEAVSQEAKPEAPSQEMLESAIRLYSTLSSEIKEKEKELEEAKGVITSYFKATKEKELIVGDVKASYSVSSRSYLDKDYLLTELGSSEFSKISEPSKKLIEKAIADRQMDAGILDKSIRSGNVSGTLRVSKIKDKSERIKDGNKGQEGQVSKGTRDNSRNEKKNAPLSLRKKTKRRNYKKKK